MTRLKLLIRSLQFYARQHVGLALGFALVSAVITASLITGDSVRHTLREKAAQRLGSIQTALTGGDRWFSADWSDQAARSLPHGTLTAPAILLRGSVSSLDGGERANQVWIYGVDDRFWRFAPGAKPMTGGVSVNPALAARLGVKEGSSILIRGKKPHAPPKDAPLSGPPENDVLLRRRVTDIESPETLGNFSLQSKSVEPMNLFLPLSDLQTMVEQEGKANVILASQVPTGVLEKALIENAKLADVGLSRQKSPESQGKEWQTSRIFFDPPVEEALRAAFPGLLPAVTYLVNDISANGRHTPYSMATGVDGVMNRYAPDSGEDAVALNPWLAADLQAKVGDKITLRYFRFTESSRLTEETSTFTVAAILPADAPELNPRWTPDFPGVSDAENCRDWDPGVPMKIDGVIRDKDEDYWDKCRGTPKLFMKLAKAEQIWGNRFGSHTSLLPAATDAPVMSDAAATKSLFSDLTLAEAGLGIRDVNGDSSQSAQGSVQFDQLFLGMSFFLIAAALTLAALFLLFLLEQRSRHIGTLMSLGWPGRRVFRLLFSESMIVVVIGALLGLIPGWLLAQATLYGLSGWWAGATGGLHFSLKSTPTSLLVPVVASVVLGGVTVFFALRSLLKTSPRDLVAGVKAGISSQGTAHQGKSRFWKSPWLWVCIFLPSALGLLYGATQAPNTERQGLFFSAGFCLLMAGLCGLALLLRHLRSGKTTLTSLRALGVSNAARHPGRSLASVGLMAAGVFLVTAVNAFRASAPEGDAPPSSGTGGFPLYGDSSLPVYEDLNSPAGRGAFGLEADEMKGVSVVPFRQSDGEDASCLNLNKVIHPLLLAVNPAPLAERGAFSFVARALMTDKSPWLDLQATATDGSIPAIGDKNTVMYALGKRVGDTISYKDQNGRPFEVRIVGMLSDSLLQGALILDEDLFLQKYPDAGGYRRFLIDAPVDRGAALSELLTRQLASRGLSVEPASAVLNRFNTVQNTYIGMFSFIGGLGVLLGTAGLGGLMLRGALERRSELGVMRALGFSRPSLARLLVSEQWFLHLLAVVMGIFCALLAVLPMLRQQPGALPWKWLLAVNGLVLLVGMLILWFAARHAANDPSLTDTIRNE